MSKTYTREKTWQYLLHRQKNEFARWKKTELFSWEGDSKISCYFDAEYHSAA